MPDTSAAVPDLVEAWRTLLSKAQRPELPPAVRPATVNFNWGGGGVPIVLANTDPVLVEVPFPSRIVWAHLYAGDATGLPMAVTASVEVRVTQFTEFGGSVALYGSGTVPALSSASRADLDLTGWQVNLITGDALIGRLLTFTGAATWVTLSLLLRPTDVPIGVTSVIDATSNSYTDANGNLYVYR